MCQKYSPPPQQGEVLIYRKSLQKTMGSAKKMLVIEDEQDIQTLLEYNLGQAGFEVLQSENGEEGLWLAIERRPDLILLDWMLPLLSGIEVLRQLRNRANTRDIPVIMMTARGEEGDRLLSLIHI